MDFEKPNIEALDKKEELERIRKDFENRADAEGFGIDKSIKETVIILNALGMPTSESCEEHIEEGVPAPWVRISAPNEPGERFVGQNASFEKVAEKYKMSDRASEKNV